MKLLICLLMTLSVAFAQMDEQRANQAEKTGISVEIKNIARFRGVRKNQVLGYGLVVGLEGTGDSKKTPFTSTLLANALKEFGTMVDAVSLDARNVATVAITAEIDPYASPGNQIDITVTSIGDAKSLQGGFLLQSPLFGANDRNSAIAVAQGPVSIGGFNVGGGGSSVQKNHVNAGRIPNGGIIERAIPFQIVYGDKMFIELDEGDITTANRIAEAITKFNPSLFPVAVDGGTIQLTVPAGTDPVTLMAMVEKLTVNADIKGLIVINERTGTIVIGGNVRIAPVVISHGSLRVTIDQINDVSQPNPLSTGTTTPVQNTQVTAEEETSEIGMLGPINTVSDLAKVFQALKVGPRDMISIIQALKEQGAIKARVKII